MGSKPSQTELLASAAQTSTSKVPLALSSIGAGICSSAYLAYHQGPASFRGAATMIGLLGAAILLAGLVSLFFALATSRSFEWFLAWRYLRRQNRSWTTFIVGVILLLVAGGLLLASHLAAPDPIGGIQLGPTPVTRGLQFAALGVFRLAIYVLVFGTLLLVFSVFTCISIFGVYLGISALVVVLSVMGGFEYDLRSKILGTRAHIVVRKQKSMFTEYRKVLPKVAAMDGVAAVAPFIESEVMVTSQTNLSGVLVRGIDPERITKVTDLPSYLKAPGASGKLSNLLHPERLAKIPKVPFGAPRVPLPGSDKGPNAGVGAAATSKPATSKPAASKPVASKPAASKPAASKPAASKPAASKSAPRPPTGVDPATMPAPPRGVDPATMPAPVAGVDPTTMPVPVAGVDPTTMPVRPTSKPSGDLGRVAPRPVYPGVIVGAELARNLRLYVGDDVNLVSPLGGMSPAGPIPKSRPFRVAGIFYSGMYEYDTKFAYVTIPEAQRFLGLDDEITGLEIKLDDVKQASEMAKTIAAALGPSFEVKDWQQLNRNLFSALKLEKVVMFIVLIFIVLVASFSIVTNLIMMVLEKGREIGALKAIGASNQSLLRVFIYAGMYIGVIGMLAGVVEGIGICTYLGQIGLPLDPEVYYISQLPVRMSPPDIALVALAGISLSFLATIYPALRAAQLQPVDALRS